MLQRFSGASLRTTVPFRTPLLTRPRRYQSSGKPPQSSHRPGGQSDQVKFFPLLAIFLLGTGAYVYMVKKRAALPQQEISGETKKTGRYQRNA